MCVKNATGAMPVPRKLWLMSGKIAAGWARKQPLSLVGAHKLWPTARVSSDPCSQAAALQL